MDVIQNTLSDSAAGVDFVGTPTRGSNRLISQFEFFSTEFDDIQNNLNSTDIIENTL
jgi:hypothetical protein